MTEHPPLCPRKNNTLVRLLVVVGQLQDSFLIHYFNVVIASEKERCYELENLNVSSFMKTTSPDYQERGKEKISGALNPHFLGATLDYSLSRFLLSAGKNKDNQNLILKQVEGPFLIWAQQFSSIIEISYQELLPVFSHRSISSVYPELTKKNYEKLEILGDTVLNLLMTEKVIDMFPHFNEGQISKIRASLVNSSELRDLGIALKLNDLILVGKGELETRENHFNIIADCFEALIGAVYLASNRNMHISSNFLDWCFKQYQIMYQKDFISEDKFQAFDPKTKLQEWSMSFYKTLPEYRDEMIQERPTTLFKVELYLRGEKISETISSTKKKGQMKLAYDYMININEKTDNTLNKGEESLC